MSFRKPSQILAIASLSSPQFNANPFLPLAIICSIYRFNSLAYRHDGVGAAVMGICRIFESSYYDDLP
jgi:hypothetical protein